MNLSGADLTGVPFTRDRSGVRFQQMLIALGDLLTRRWYIFLGLLAAGGLDLAHGGLVVEHDARLRPLDPPAQRLAIAALIGLGVTIPLLGHATWHAYRDTVAPQT